MPPKPAAKQRRVSMAPGTKVQDGAAAVTLSKNYRNVGNVTSANPIKRTNMARTADIRKARDSYAQQIAFEQAEQERDKIDLRKKILEYKKDNEKLLKNQKLKWGMTFDDMKIAREQLLIAKESNDILYKELETKKDDCGKLESEIELLTNKINIAMLELGDLNRERKSHEKDKAKIVEYEQHAGKLLKANRELRSTLLRNKVDPNVDALTNKRTDLFLPQLPAPQPTRRVSYQPNLITSENLLSFRSMEDVRAKKKTRKTNLNRTKSLSQQYMSPKIFLTQYSNRSLGNVEVYV